MIWFCNFVYSDTSMLSKRAMIINDTFDIVFEEILSLKEAEIFKKIMENNTEALLYQTHPKLGKAAIEKIKHLKEIGKL